MKSTIVTEYVNVYTRLATESPIAEDVEQQLYARLDQLWYMEMSADDRDAARELAHQDAGRRKTYPQRVYNVA
jgi:hypothetical protein